jgi:hypothetical protein
MGRGASHVGVVHGHEPAENTEAGDASCVVHNLGQALDALLPGDRVILFTESARASVVERAL